VFTHFAAKMRNCATRPFMTDRIVHCRKLNQELPGLSRPPYKNELGQKLFAEVSKEAWALWLKDSVKYINTYRLDLSTTEGQKFMLRQCAIYFGFEEGELVQTAWVAPDATSDAASGSGTP
jgi:Fe-S cluster biosynthesis and repair protein YggX